ncbi:MAG: DEAD/DEAH box helicase family protein [Kiritimatiellae bacterium]|nr:DEAD/DEAH box helicase family protein [Kiritimatiellia bacterium]
MAINLRDYQLKAVNEMKNGCILCGGVGSGKSRTAIAYYFRECGGGIEDPKRYSPMTNPRDLYIITTARKRDTREWEGELTPFLISPDPELTYYKSLNVVIDSWNNIKKYSNVYGAFFIFDEQRVVGSGAWVKAFLKIAKKNKWILLSATPGDTWTDYIPVFRANGFYKTKQEFIDEHVVYSRFSKYPKIDRYVNTGRLIRQRNQILVDMEFERGTVSHHEDVYVRYDLERYRDVTKERKNPFKTMIWPDGSERPAPIKNASELCYVWRRIVNSDQSRQVALLEVFEKHPKMIIFYNFDYELEILKEIFSNTGVDVAEWNGHKHQPVPESKTWVYLVQYTAGAEGWNCITTDTIVFYSQNYSYKIMQQSAGRIDRLNTPFKDLYYYHLKSRSGIDLMISRALRDKKNFNESKYVKW